ncbi:MAG: hypothetical protein FD147_2593 [Chloroflexi bacterium]|nr:MAG: hypothetical protein FD147_2593 [Chloroflexota bacterium]
MRKVIIRGPLLRVSGEVITVKGIYVRTGVGLPRLGESLILENDQTDHQYSGVVVLVDHQKSAYDARFKIP